MEMTASRTMCSFEAPRAPGDAGWLSATVLESARAGTHSSSVNTKLQKKLSGAGTHTRQRQEPVHSTMPIRVLFVRPCVRVCVPAPTDRYRYTVKPGAYILFTGTVGRGERSTPGLRLFLRLLSRSRFSCGFVSLGLGGWL